MITRRTILKALVGLPVVAWAAARARKAEARVVCTGYDADKGVVTFENRVAGPLHFNARIIGCECDACEQDRHNIECTRLFHRLSCHPPWGVELPVSDA